MIAVVLTLMRSNISIYRDYISGEREMDSRKKLYITIAALITGLITFSCLGIEQEMEQQAPAAESNPAAQPDFPYFAEIMGDNVYVRSGPGTNYYRCGKLGHGYIVKIVSATNVWSRILPPEGFFSWISKQYVAIDSSNPDMGVVTGDEVRVYAGSQYYEPIHSDRIQVHLNRSDKVMLLGEEMGDYYKIVPPSGAFFWVSTQYTKPITMPAAEPQPAPQLPAVAEPEPAVEPTPPSQAVVPTTIPADSQRLRQYYDAQGLIKAEFKKPLSEQNYSQPKKILDDLLAADDSDKAARYAKYSLGQIERYKLAAAVEQEINLQETELNQIYSRIDEVQSERLADFQDLGQFAVIGDLKTSNVYGPEQVMLHYIITDSDSKVICYALPTGGASHTDLSEFVGKKVGLIGQIEPHPQTAGALVKFTEIKPVM
jgi:uncharacterized protein YgiM (DUF1202 family)